MNDLKINIGNNNVNTPLTDGPGTICKVCGDRASGKHYGVPSCDGCRGFFKRSIRRNLEYICKEGGHCTVDVSRRNQCQSCRFAKCLRSNMRREAVQHERAPRTCLGNQTNTHISGLPIDIYSCQRRLPIHSNGIILPLPIHIPAVNFNAYPSFEQSRFIPSLPTINNNNNNNNNINNNNNNNNNNINNNNNNNNIMEVFQFGNGIFSSPPPLSSLTSITTSPLIVTTTSVPTATIGTTKMFNSTPKHINLNDNIFGYNNGIINRLTPTSSTNKYFSTAISNDNTVTILSAKEDEVTSSEEINVSEMNPYLHYKTTTTTTTTASAPNNNISSDREAIFESAAKLLFLAVKWAKTIPSFSQILIKDQKLLLEECWAELFVITAAQHGLSFEQIVTTSTTDLRARKLQKIINQVIMLRIDHTELACLKALILFRSDCFGLTATHQITLLQEQTLNLLLDTCGGTRTAHLLLILPCIRSAADPKLLQELLFKKTVGEVAIERLLGELIRN